MLVPAIFQFVPSDGWRESERKYTNKKLLPRVKSCTMHVTGRVMTKLMWFCQWSHGVVTWRMQIMNAWISKGRPVNVRYNHVHSAFNCVPIYSRSRYSGEKKNQALLHRPLTEGISGFLQSSNGAALTEVKISCQSRVSNCCRGSKHISRLHLLPFNEVDQVNVEAGVVQGKQCLVSRVQFARESRFHVFFFFKDYYELKYKMYCFWQQCTRLALKESLLSLFRRFGK